MLNFPVASHIRSPQRLPSRTQAAAVVREDRGREGDAGCDEEDGERGLLRDLHAVCLRDLNFQSCDGLDESTSVGQPLGASTETLRVIHVHVVGTGEGCEACLQDGQDEATGWVARTRLHDFTSLGRSMHS
jgi:hypothetical protein